MSKPFEKKSILLVGASALAMSIFSPAAFAQDGATAAAEDASSAEDSRISTITVTTQKQAESIQDVPIAVSAFDESAVERLQLTGGPDLVKAIPNVNFTKGNFGGFNFKIRGVGVDVIAQSGDAGVGVHQNDIPLTANRLFEAEFYDIERIEVLRGPQGTLYGRNATGGVFNLITAKPQDGEFAGSAELSYGNHNSIRAKGMLNVPIVDGVAFRLAGAYLKRDGYVKNSVTGNDIDGRDLWAARATLALEPTDWLRGWISYDHFEEEDSRLRAGKQLCKKDPTKTSYTPAGGTAITIASPLDQGMTSLGCRDVPLDEMDGIVNSAGTLGGGLAITAGLLNGDAYTGAFDTDLRSIGAAFDPIYTADQDLFSWNVEFDVSDNITATYLGSFNKTSSVSREDYNKVGNSITFNTTGNPLFNPALSFLYSALFPGGNVADPQLGTSNIFRTYDISGGKSDGTSHEFRLQSDYDGFFNFNLGMINVDVNAIDPTDPTAGYYVFSNSLTALTQLNNALIGNGLSATGIFGGCVPIANGAQPNCGPDGTETSPSLFAGVLGGDDGNYFRSLSPYELESFSLFGEAYFNLTDDLKLTVGVRETNDDKRQANIPTFLFTPVNSPVLTARGGDPFAPLPVTGVTDSSGYLNASFQERTGRVGFDWKPDLGFSDDSLFYVFYSKGYKGGGINPPLPAGSSLPQFFDPEFVNAWEVGTKNTFGDQQLNLTAFKYDYEGYQTTQIINRTSINLNIDAELQGLELEYLIAPSDDWLFSVNAGFLDSQVVDSFGIDVLDRANGRSDLVVLKNSATYANCVVSAAGYAAVLRAINAGALPVGATRSLCTGGLAGLAATLAPFNGGAAIPNVSYVNASGNTVSVGGLTPFDGEAKNLDGNTMTGAPELTVNLAAEYTLPFMRDSGWDVVLRGDVYYQGESFSRIWNTARDRIDAWHNVNAALQLTNEDAGLQIEAFAKNLTDEEVITGAYLTDDSSGLFTNIFLTEPASYGVTVRKTW